MTGRYEILTWPADSRDGYNVTRYDTAEDLISAWAAIAASPYRDAPAVYIESDEYGVYVLWRGDVPPSGVELLEAVKPGAYIPPDPYGLLRGPAARTGTTLH